MAPNQSDPAAAKVRTRLRLFRRDQRGATAIEFAFVALPFFALLFAIIETALVFFAEQALESAVSNSARLIRTGQAQSSKMSASAFKANVCDQISALFKCTEKLVVDVQTFDSFADITMTPPVDKNGNLDLSYKYETGHGGDIVVVRAYYEWPLTVQLLGLDLSNTAKANSHLLAAAAAFRNEPFPW
jgi:Flp pilus assembly protein TadG